MAVPFSGDSQMYLVLPLLLLLLRWVPISNCRRCCCCYGSSSPTSGCRYSFGERLWWPADQRAHKGINHGVQEVVVTRRIGFCSQMWWTHHPQLAVYGISTSTRAWPHAPCFGKSAPRTLLDQPAVTWRLSRLLLAPATVAAARSCCF